MVASLAAPAAADPDASSPRPRKSHCWATRLRDALTTLRQARTSAGSSRRTYLYDLPWYMFIGPPGAGKTTALANSGLNFPLAGRQVPGPSQGRRRHPQLRLVVHRRRRADRHRRPLHHPGQPRGGRQGGLGGLPHAAQDASPPSADQRRAGVDQPVRPCRALRSRAHRPCPGHQGAHPRAAHPVRHPLPDLRAVHQVRPGRRVHRVLLQSRQGGARAGLGHDLPARRGHRTKAGPSRISRPSSTSWSIASTTA